MVVDRTQLIHPTKRLDQILLARNEFVYTLRSISVAHTGTRHGDDDLHGRLRRNPMSAARSPSICRILPASTSSIHFHVLRLSKCAIVSSRRRVLELMAGLVVLAPIPAFAAASRSDFADMPALRGKDYGKSKMRYPDYVETGSGLQYKDLKVGIGAQAKPGDVVVVDWDGYTIGYYGRIFEARNKTKGGSFEGGDKDFFKFKLGSHEVIPAFEEAVPGMAPGGIRRIIVPPDLGYPDNDSSKSGPKPTTFSGQRALDFVLRNQGLIDKTLLFDVELLKILPS